MGDKRTERVDQLVVQDQFKDLTSFKNMFKFNLFMRRADIKQALIEPKTSWSNKNVTCSSLVKLNDLQKKMFKHCSII